MNEGGGVGGHAHGSRMMLGMRGPGSVEGGTGPGKGIGSVDMDGQEAFDQLEASWLTWVIVSGIPPGTGSGSSATAGTGCCSRTNEVLLRMQEFGNIVDHAVSEGNWMFVKYSSPFQAERASINPVLFLGPGTNTMLSVTRLNAPLARTLNLQIDGHGSLVIGGGGGSVAAGSLSFNSSQGQGGIQHINNEMIRIFMTVMTMLRNETSKC